MDVHLTPELAKKRNDLAATPLIPLIGSLAGLGCSAMPYERGTGRQPGCHVGCEPHVAAFGLLGAL